MPRRQVRLIVSRQDRLRENSMTELPQIQPPQELVDILLPAFGPCPAMQPGKCRGHVKDWAPEGGYVLRGFRGATGRLDEVELVLVCTEPGNAYPDEAYDGPTALVGVLQIEWYGYVQHAVGADLRSQHHLVHGSPSSPPSWPQAPASN